MIARTELGTISAPGRSSAYALGMLFVVGLVNYIDRLALSILQVPIKDELGLSDAQLGLLTGIAFFIPYTLLSWPLARLADRVNRKYVLAAVLAVWSSATALVSTVQGFGALLLLRMGVAVGEAGCLPTSYSLLADHFSPGRRAKAIAVFVLSFPLGSMIGLAGVGALADAVGWRNSFLIIGVFGLVLAPIVLLTMREPARGESDPKSLRRDEAMPGIGATLRMLWDLKSFRSLAAAAALQAFVVGTILSWGPPFYVRVHELDLSTTALLFGGIVGIGGGIGSYLGGMLGDRLGSRDRRWYAWLPCIACALTVPIGLAQFMIASAHASLSLGLICIVLINIFLAPTYAVTQSLVSPNVRAFTSATLVAATAIAGSGLGPFVTGTLSDYLLSQHGMHETSLRYAICAAILPAALASWGFARAAVHLET